MNIGFIGQGFVGKSYSDEFESRGMPVVRYALEPEYAGNKEKIAECDIVFIAVPTPTTPEGFDFSIVQNALTLIGTGKTAVIKSTILPGTTAKLQAAFPDIFVLFSPEFLSQVTAKEEAAKPMMNIVGIPIDLPEYHKRAEAVMEILPETSHAQIVKAEEAECIKYIHNINGYVQIVLFNILYDVASKMDCDWNVIHEAVKADPLIGNRYANPVHKSGRGAGGACFIKDFAAFRSFAEPLLGDARTSAILDSLEAKNIDLLTSSGKDLDLLRGVYGSAA